jgi:hypothetical protein
MSLCFRQKEAQRRVSIQSLADMWPNAILATQVQLTMAMALSPDLFPGDRAIDPDLMVTMR